jgi:DNA repair protein RadC
MSELSVLPLTPMCNGLAQRLVVSGAESLLDYEVLALAAATPAESLLDGARRFCYRADGLRALPRYGTLRLAADMAVDTEVACRIHAAVELGRRVLISSCTLPDPCVTPEHVFRYYHPRLTGRDVEEFWVLYVDARHRPLQERRVATGSAWSCAVDPASVLRAALECRAAAMIFVHNHPSGDPEPSSQDVLLTTQLRAGGALVGIDVLDHVVIAETSYVSMHQRGLLR